MSRKSIAVVGGSGFIGTRLCDLLDQRTDVTFKILDIEKSSKYPKQWVAADIRDKPSLIEPLKGVDTVINLAAEHKDNISPKSRYYSTNVDGQKNLCEAMDATGCKHLIFTSSVAVYGFVTEDTGENGKIKPFHEYGDSKYKAELAAEAWLNEDKHLAVIRPTVVFGEGNRGNVYNLLKQIATGRFLMIGSGKNKKSMAYVGNIAAFLNHLIDKPTNHQVFNYADKPDFDMNELVYTVNKSLNKKTSSIKIPIALGLTGGYCFDLLATITNKEFPISSIRVKKFCARTQFKTQTDLADFRQPFSLEDGLSKTVKYEFRKQ